MSSRRQRLLVRVNWYLQSSLKHITEEITYNRFYYRGGRYGRVSLYIQIATETRAIVRLQDKSAYKRCTYRTVFGHNYSEYGMRISLHMSMALTRNKHKIHGGRICNFIRDSLTFNPSNLTDDKSLSLTHISLLPYISVSESGQHWFR